MGLRGWLAVAAVVAAIALAVLALVLAFAAATSQRARPAAVAMTRAQRRRAAVLVRRGGPVDGDELAGVHALAGVKAGQGHLALFSAAGIALACEALVFPWSPPLMPGWVRALFLAALVLQAAAALPLLVSIRRARRFLADHPDPGAAARSGARR